MNRASSGVTTPKSAPRPPQACRRNGAEAVVCQAANSAFEVRDLLLQLGNGDDCLSRPLVCLLYPQRLHGQLVLDYAELTLQLVDGLLAMRDPEDQAFGLGLVLPDPAGVELPVRLCLFGPVASGIATRLHELCVGDASGCRPEDDRQDRGKRDEEEGAGQQGTCHHERRDNDERNGGQEADASLTATDIGGTHMTQIKTLGSSLRTRHARSRATAASVRIRPASDASNDRATRCPASSESRPIQLTAYPA